MATHMNAPDEFASNPLLAGVWIAVGVPGFAGAEKGRRTSNPFFGEPIFHWQVLRRKN